ncbi:melanocyte protein PMEL [Gastrophryne carolinensis]
MMGRVWHLAVLWMLYVGIAAQNRSGSRIQQSKQEIQSNRRPPFRSWNSQMYPIWKGSETQKRECWKGGQVTFSLQNDAPTLTGAKATFFIQLNFPQNQTVLPDGQVVWSQNRTNNGTWDPVFPDETAEGSHCTFPDGSPFPQDAEKRRSKFVYVWQAWGKYWQVVDGPSSNLTVETDDIPLGSHTMQVVVYHYRGRQKFIPIGATSSQFAITDQIPVSVSISQVLDLDEEDQRFIQNRAVSFSVNVHDPSHYLQEADISFSWDFGDQSGTLITLNTGVTHTYVTPGVFKAKVVVQAAVPVTPCGSSAPMIATTVLPVVSTTRVAASTGVPEPVTSGSQTDAPVTAAGPGNSTVLDEAAALNDEINAEALAPETDPDSENEASPVADNEEATTAAVVPNEEGVAQAEGLDTEAVPNEEEVLPEAVPTEAVPAAEEGALATEAVPAAEEGALATEAVPAAEGALATEAVPAAEEGALATEAVPAAEEGALATEAVPAAEEGALATEAVPAAEEGALATEAVPAAEEGALATEAVPAAEEGAPVTELTEAIAATEAGEVLLLAKRQAPEGPLVGCLLYRYGTYAADLDIVSGIESVQIVQVEPIVSAGLENTVDLTVTCQGSIPSQVCTVISGPDCETPQQTICNPVEPSSDCQLVLRQVFNDTGVFCVNVSLADDVSLAVASAQVSVLAGAASSVNGIAVTVGVLLAALAIATVAYTYRHVKSYTPLRSTHSSVNWLPDRSSVWVFIQNAFGRTANGEHSPLLNGRVV